MLKLIPPFITMVELTDMDTLFLLLNAKPPPRESAVKSQFRLLAQFLARCASLLLVKSVTQLLVKSATLLLTKSATQFPVKCATPWPVKSATLSPGTFPRLCALPMLWRDASHLQSLSLKLCVFPSQSPTATQSRSRFPVKSRSVCLSPEKSVTQFPDRNATLSQEKSATLSPTKSATQLNRRFLVRSVPPLTPKLMLLPPSPFTQLLLLVLLEFMVLLVSLVMPVAGKPKLSFIADQNYCY